MSFSGGKSSIFDQVNRFFTNSDHVLVKEDLNDLEPNSENKSYQLNSSLVIDEHEHHRQPQYEDTKRDKSNPGRKEDVRFFNDELNSEKRDLPILSLQTHNTGASANLHSNFHTNLDSSAHPHAVQQEEYERLFHYLKNGAGKFGEETLHPNEYLDSFDTGSKQIVSAQEVGADGFTLLKQMVPSGSINTNINPFVSEEQIQPFQTSSADLTSMVSVQDVSGVQKKKRHSSTDMVKRSPGISPTVDAMQPPQYTPYLQARTNRFAATTTSNKKVVKNSPNMKASIAEKKNTYKVILPSNTSPMMLPRSAANYSHVPNSFSKNSDDWISMHSDINFQSSDDNSLVKTKSNSSVTTLKDNKKVLRATQSPVIRPMKKKLSVPNFKKKIDDISSDFQLDGKDESNGVLALKKTHSNDIHKKTVRDPFDSNNDHLFSDSFKPANNNASSAFNIQAPSITDNPPLAKCSSGGRTKNKEGHKEAEKVRRERLNVALEDLNDIIPDEIKKSDKFPSKATTVENAAEYIRYLVGELVKRNIEIELTVPKETFISKENKKIL